MRISPATYYKEVVYLLDDNLYFPKLTKERALPVEYTINKQQCIVFTTLSGTLNFDECLLHHQKLADDPDFKPALRELIDGGAVDHVSIFSNAIFNLSKSCPFGIHARRAIFSSGKLMHYNLAKMFQAFAGEQHGEIRVFKDRKEAFFWLGIH